MLYTKYWSDTNYSYSLHRCTEYWSSTNYSYSLHRVKFPVFHDATGSSVVERLLCMWKARFRSPTSPHLYVCFSFHYVSTVQSVFNVKILIDEKLYTIFSFGPIWMSFFNLLSWDLELLVVWQRMFSISYGFRDKLNWQGQQEFQNLNFLIFHPIFMQIFCKVIIFMGYRWPIIYFLQFYF